MTRKQFCMTEGIAQGIDPDMTLSDIAHILRRMNSHYPTERCNTLARELAEELGEAYLDKMCQRLMEAPFWNQRNQNA